MEPQKKLKLLVAALPAAIAALEDDAEEQACLTDSTDSGSEWQMPPAPPRNLPKNREYFNIVESMDVDEFSSHFRMKQGDKT